MRVLVPTIRSVSKCQLCILHEQGVVNPEDYVLAQYMLPDPSKPPIPIEYDDSIAGGVLLLYPEEKMQSGDIIPQTGGIIGTVRSMFRVLGFAKEKVEPPLSKAISSGQRTGLFGPNKSRRN